MTVQARALLGDFAELAGTDVTCHLGQWPYRLGAAADADGLRAYAKRHGLRCIWVSHLACLFGFDTRTGNEAALADCAEDPLFRVMVVVDPRDPGWRTELEWAVGEGAGGVRVAPGFHDYPVSAVTDVIDACSERMLPVQVIARIDDARVRHRRYPARDLEPHDLADLVRARPAHPVVLSGLNFGDATELGRHLGDALPPSVRLDLWHVNGPTGLADRLAAEPERWAFGSGHPVQTAEATMLQLMASKLTREQRALIVSA